MVLIYGMIFAMPELVKRPGIGDESSSRRTFPGSSFLSGRMEVLSWFLADGFQAGYFKIPFYFFGLTEE
jgi:hypothetical protein